MINEFLTRLDNIPRHGFDGIYRDPAAVTKPLSGNARTVWRALFGDINSSEHFRIACEIVGMLRGSQFAEYETKNLDPRVTYNETDLALVLSAGANEVVGTSNLSLLVQPDTPSKQTWTVTYNGSGEVTSVDEDGLTNVQSVVFGGGTTHFPLAGNNAFGQFLQDPGGAASWTINRQVTYASYFADMASRIGALPSAVLNSVVPVEIQSVIRDMATLRPMMRVLAVAIGVVHAGS